MNWSKVCEEKMLFRARTVPFSVITNSKATLCMTGGQVKYVVELAKNLARHPAVHRVDLLTRLIADPRVDSSYGEPEECLLSTTGSLGGAYIVRLPCGDPDVYLR